MKLREMKIGFLLLLLIFGFSLWANAQTGEGEIENWVETTLICQTKDAWLLQVDVSENISQVGLYPDVDDGWVWTVDKTKTRRFWVERVNTQIFVYVEVWDGGGYQADALILEQAEDCPQAQSSAGIVPNECLGMSLDEFIAMTNYKPLDYGFVVDGLLYEFHETLSFFVPQDAVWNWDLYVDGRHLLSFEQTEDSACHVSNVYPQ